MKMQKNFIFVNKSLKIYIFIKDKKYCKLIDHRHYAGEYRGAVQYT